MTTRLMKPRFLLLPLLISQPLAAGTRSAPGYTIPADTTDSGGARTTSPAYSNDGSAGAVAGLSTTAAPAETVKHGYIGQLYDVTALTLAAPSLHVDEGAAIQLAAWQTLDDLSVLHVPANAVTWGVRSGPLTSVSTAGLATAAPVYQDTAAVAEGTFAGLTGTLSLTVRNTGDDDLGLYAGDGLEDLWQVEHFGLDNPLAAPLPTRTAMALTISVNGWRSLIR